MLYKVLRVLIALCLISIGSGIVVTIVSMIAGWEDALFFGVSEITYGLYGIVVCGLVQAGASLTNKLPKSVKTTVKATAKKHLKKRKR
jgi:hypothetical protein